jgi:ribosomal protein L19
MKKSILLFLVIITQFSFAQTIIKLEDFSDVKVFDQLNVTLIPSTENKVEITGTNQDKVEVVNKKGVLKIRMTLTKMIAGDKTKVTLYFKKIQSIDANEGSVVSCKDVFKQTTFDLSTQEGASITVVLDVDKTSIKAFSGGIISITGKAITQSVVINSGGILKASSLETAQTTVSISAGGDADVYATTLVDAKVTAGGTISIYGNPKEIRQQTSMGGSIVTK